jgi:hypothetical protein
MAILDSNPQRGSLRWGYWLSVLALVGLLAGCRQSSESDDKGKSTAPTRFSKRPSFDEPDGSGGKGRPPWLGKREVAKPTADELAVIDLAERLGGTVERADPPVRAAGVIYLPSPSDEDLRLVAKLSEIESLKIDGAGFTDQGLKAIAEVPDISTLHLCGEAVTDNCLAQFADHATLRILILERTKVGKEGLAALSTNEALTYVDMTDVAITPDMLEGLKQLRMVRELRFVKTDISPADREVLEQHLPDCTLLVETEE